MRSWKTPTTEQINKVVALTSHPGRLRYFFNGLDNPMWIEPLAKHGFFAKPPPEYTDETSGSVVHPPWPEARYLARMASLNPDLVLSFLKKLERTENESVLSDIVDAALNLPPELAEALIRHIFDWLTIGQNYPLLDRIVDLTIKFADAMRLDIAIILFKKVFAILPDPDQVLIFQKADAYSLPPQPRILFKFLEYAEHFRKVTSYLQKAAPRRTLDMLVELLNDVIFKSRIRHDNMGPEDLSYVWRPAIEQHPHNYRDDLENLLTDGVRDAAVTAVKQSGLSSITTFLDAQRWRIFHRVSLHIITLFGDQDLSATKRRILDFEIYDEPGTRHEASVLLAAYYSRLSTDDRAQYLQWVNSGPDVNDYRERSRANYGRDITDADVQDYVMNWKVERLWPIRDLLTGQWQDTFEDMRSKTGIENISTIDAPIVTISWPGGESPRSKEELKEMEISELAEFLRSWKPVDDFIAASVHGLVDNLSSLAEEAPSTYSANLSQFKDLDVSYLHAFLYGFRQAVRGGKDLAWDQVLDFCADLVSSRLDTRQVSLGRRANRMYTEATVRQVMAELIADSLQNEKSGLLPRHSAKIWQIIRPLTSDPEHTTEPGNNWFEKHTDPPTVSINTTRGWAMHAAISYALWDGLRGSDDKFTFSQKDDLRDLLELHLNPLEEQSLSIHSIYGRYLPSLYYADPEWMKKQRLRIFPRDDGRRWAAAWTTYIKYCRANDGVFAYLEDEYRAAINHLKGYKYELPGVSESAVAQNLAEHLMSLYWCGTISLSHDSLLLTFYENSSDELCAYAADYVVRSVESTEGNIPKKVMDRLRSLWSNRISKISEEVDAHRKELGAFGLWFRSEQFGDEWGLDVLMRVLKLGSRPEHIYHLLDRLLPFAKVMPEKFLRCGMLLINATKNTYDLHIVIAKLMTVLPSLSKSRSEVIVQHLRALVNRMGELGYDDARIALPQ